MNLNFVDINNIERNIPLEGYSDEALELEKKIYDVILHYQIPQTRENVIKRFYNLSATWKQATILFSSITEIAVHPAYQEIIGMGSSALPLIFKSLQDELDHWFWALKAITGEDPVNSEDRGDLEKMREAWLQWGKENGCI